MDELFFAQEQHTALMEPMVQECVRSCVVGSFVISVRKRTSAVRLMQQRMHLGIALRHYTQPPATAPPARV